MEPGSSSQNRGESRAQPVGFVRGGRQVDLKKYVANRRKELQAERAALASRNQMGITTGALMGFDQKARVTETLLAEFENLANWEAEGEPDYVAPLADDEKAFWLKAAARGVEIPDEIKAQL